MTIEEALASIVGDGINLGAGDFVDVEALKVAADVLHKVIEGSLVPPGCDWIPVSERLPDKDGTYICFNRGAYGKWTQSVRFTKDARKFDEYTFKNKWKNQWLMYDSEYGYYAVDSITHWMPLPEPPKEDTVKP
jgi:hypothetical protein